MAEYIIADDLHDEINRIYNSATSRLVIVIPIPQLNKLNLTTLTNLGDNPKLKIQILVNAPSRTMVFPLSFLRKLLKLSNMELLYHKGNLIQQFLNDGECLTLPRGLEITNYEKAGIKSSIGINDDQDVIRAIEESTLLLKMEPKFKSKYLGLSKKYIDSNKTTDRLNEFFALVES